VGEGDTNPGLAFSSDCPSPATGPVFAPGITRIPFRAATTYQGCGGEATPPIRSCLPDNHLPPLPAGEATVWFETDGTIPHLVVPTGPIAIQIVSNPSRG
jgi:hypothetical protein